MSSRIALDAVKESASSKAYGSEQIQVNVVSNVLWASVM